MEACGTAHYWGRVAQQDGHTVTLLPPAYVRPYVRRNKTDRTDAEAILEAVRSGRLPSVPVKRVEQQALVAVHRVREQWMTTRTARINTLRGILRSRDCCCRRALAPPCRRCPTVWKRRRRRLPNYLRQMLTLVHEEVRTIETPHRGSRARVARASRRRSGRDATARRFRALAC